VGQLDGGEEHGGVAGREEVVGDRRGAGGEGCQQSVSVLGCREWGDHAACGGGVMECERRVTSLFV